MEEEEEEEAYHTVRKGKEEEGGRQGGVMVAGSEALKGEGGGVGRNTMRGCRKRGVGSGRKEGTGWG